MCHRYRVMLAPPRKATARPTRTPRRAGGRRAPPGGIRRPGPPPRPAWPATGVGVADGLPGDPDQAHRIRPEGDQRREGQRTADRHRGGERAPQLPVAPAEPQLVGHAPDQHVVDRPEGGGGARRHQRAHRHRDRAHRRRDAQPPAPVCRVQHRGEGAEQQIDRKEPELHGHRPSREPERAPVHSGRRADPDGEQHQPAVGGHGQQQTQGPSRQPGRRRATGRPGAGPGAARGMAAGEEEQRHDLEAQGQPLRPGDLREELGSRDPAAGLADEGGDQPVAEHDHADRQGAQEVDVPVSLHAGSCCPTPARRAAIGAGRNRFVAAAQPARGKSLAGPTRRGKAGRPVARRGRRG